MNNKLTSALFLQSLEKYMSSLLSPHLRDKSTQLPCLHYPQHSVRGLGPPGWAALVAASSALASARCWFCSTHLYRGVCVYVQDVEASSLLKNTVKRHRFVCMPISMYINWLWTCATSAHETNCGNDSITEKQRNWNPQGPRTCNAFIGKAFDKICISGVKNE